MSDPKFVFEEYVDTALASVLTISPNAESTLESEPLLNGAPYEVFRESIGIDLRRASGTFFSSPAIASRLAARLWNVLPDTAIVMDPTCGMGDLLLAYAQYLQTKETLSETLTYWGKHLAGFDLNPDLVRMTKLRLTMLARLRGGFKSRLTDIDRYFPKIRVGNMFEYTAAIRKADGFLFNPPFGIVRKVSDCEWSAGSVNAAAIFLDKLVQSMRPQSPISAVLPEVLRCGSRYRKFREAIARSSVVGGFTSLGRFDRWTDVDIFTTLLTSSRSTDLWVSKEVAPAAICVGDFFYVRVGPVVPHRHALKGPWRKYICAKTTPRWSEGFEPSASRRFEGTSLRPPFVVIRRTSSPSDKQRAVGTVIRGDDSVAAENHLIVLQPKNGSIDQCRTLLSVLQNDETTDFLNHEIRCRHLTTGVVARIPWSKSL